MRTHTGDLFKSLTYDLFVAEQTVRTSLDIPLALHRRLHEAAARYGCSARQLILRSIVCTVQEAEPQRPSIAYFLILPSYPVLASLRFDERTDS